MRGILSTAFAVCLLLSRPAAAQEQVDYTLGEIVVTATRLPDPPYGTDIFSHLALREGTTVTTTAQALNFSPSLHVTVGSKGEARLYLRGFSQREVVLLFDGHPIYEPFFGSMDLSQFPIESVARIKVAKGPASALYGPNALGGVVNLVTYGPPLSTHSWAILAAGSGGYTRLSLRHGGKRGRLYYWTALSRTKQFGYPLSGRFTATNREDGGLRDNSDARSFNLYGKLGWQKPGKGEWAISAGATRAARGVPPATRGFRPRYWRFPEWTRQFVDLSGQFHRRQNLSVHIKTYAEAFDNTLEAYKGSDFSQRRWTSTYRNRVVGVQTLLNWRPKHNLRLNASVSDKVDLVRIQDDLGKPWRTYRAATVSSGFETHWSPSARFETLAGMSFDWLRAESSRHLTSVNPQLGLIYRLTPTISVRWLSGRKSRFPTLKEWYGAFSGNAHLRPEEAWTHEFALRATPSSGFQLDLAFFRSHLRDLIQQHGRGQPFENLDQAELQGIEASASIRVPHRAALSLGLNLLNATDPVTGAPLDYRPRYKASLYAHVSLARGVSVTTVARSVGSRPYHVYDRTGRLPAYSVVDVTLYLPSVRGLRPFAAVNNVFDANYEDEFGYPMPGRQIRAGVELAAGDQHQ